MMAAAATVAHRALASGTLLLLLAPLAGGRSPGPAVSGHVGNQLYLYSDACIYPHEHVGMPYLENTSPALHVHVFDDVARARAAAAMGRQRAPDGEAIVSTVRNKWPRWNGTRWGQQLEIHHHAAQQLQGRAHVWSRAPALVLISGTLEDNLYHVLWDGFLHAAAHVAFLRNYTADSYVRSAVANSTRGKAKQRRLLPALNLNRRTRAERRGRQQFGRYDVLLQGIGLKPPLSHREMLTPHAAEQLEMMISSASTLATPLSTLWCFRRIIAALAAPTMSQPSVAVHWPPSRFLMHGAMRAWGLRCPGHRPHGGMYTPRQVANISLLDRTHGRTLQNLDTIVGAISKEVGSMAMINVVLPERLTLRQQLVLFYCHTDILVGRHGAGLGWAHAMARTRAGLEVELRSRPVLNTSWMAGRPFTPGLLELRGHWVTHRSLYNEIEGVRHTSVRQWRLQAARGVQADALAAHLAVVRANGLPLPSDNVVAHEFLSRTLGLDVDRATATEQQCRQVRSMVLKDLPKGDSLTPEQEAELDINTKLRHWLLKFMPGTFSAERTASRVHALLRGGGNSTASAYHGTTTSR